MSCVHVASGARLWMHVPSRFRSCRVVRVPRGQKSCSVEAIQLPRSRDVKRRQVSGVRS